VVGAGPAVAAGEGAAHPLSGSEAVAGSGGAAGDLVRVAHGISWTHVPLELGFGSGVTCWRRLDEWQRAGVWERLHELLLARLRAAGEIEWTRAVVDASHVQAKRGAPRRARARLIEPDWAPSSTSSSRAAAFRSRGRSLAATATT